MSGEGAGETPRHADAALALVESAAQIAAQKVARVHRRRLVVWAFLAAMAAALIVALPTTVILNQHRAQQAAENSRFNCRQWQEAASVLERLVTSLIKRRADDRALAQKYPSLIQEYHRIFGRQLVTTLLREQAVADARQQKYLRTRLVPRLDALSEINCREALTASGVETTVAPSAMP